MELTTILITWTSTNYLLCVPKEAKPPTTRFQLYCLCPSCSDITWCGEYCTEFTIHLNSSVTNFANWMICIDDDDADDFIIITSSNYLCSTSPHLNLTLYFFYHLSRYNSLIYSIFVVILIVETLYSYSMLVLMFMFIHLLLNPPVNLWLFVSSSLFKVIIIIIIIIINHLIC